MDALPDDQHAEGEEEEEGVEDGEEEDGGEEDGGEAEEGEKEEVKEEERGESGEVENRVVEMEDEAQEIPASQPQDALHDSPPPPMLPDSQPMFEENEVPLDYPPPPFFDSDTGSNDCCSKILPHGNLCCLTAAFLEKKDWCQNCLKRSEAAPKSPEQCEVINVEETPEKALSLEAKSQMIKSLERRLSAATVELANTRKENTAQILFSI